MVHLNRIKERVASFPRPWNSMGLLIGIGLAFFIFVLVLLTMFFSPQKKSAQQNEGSASSDAGSHMNASNVLNSSGQTIVYGSWSSHGSDVHSYNMETKKNSLLANLPKNIKKITILSSDQLLFINKTDATDRGSELAIYNLTTKTIKTVFHAENGFGIDDYVLSPDKRLIVDWEARNSQKNTLLGGQSRVFSAKVGENALKNLIYAEDSLPAVPIHYPRAVTDEGTIYLDTFLPNSGAGWAYGMSTASFDGVTKQDIANMPNGTYGTQPQLSSDGRYLVFAGYNGAFGPGTQLAEGFRQALVTPNTVELYDTKTGERLPIDAFSPQNSYPTVQWDPGLPNAILVTMVSHHGEPIKNARYVLTTKVLDLLTLPEQYAVIGSVDKTQVSVGVMEDAKNQIANLGSEYSALYSRIGIYNTTTKKISFSFAENSFGQIIDFLHASSGTPVALKTPANNSTLQMDSFRLQTTLPKKRQAQQSNPIAIKVPVSLPAQSLPPSNEPPACGRLSQAICDAAAASGGIPGLEGKASCIQEILPTRSCDDSPLYLYGPEGKQVHARIHTPIFNSNAPGENNTYEIFLEKNNSLSISGKPFDSIMYSYRQAVAVSTPENGRIVSLDNVSVTLADYAEKLSLNDKETNDLLFYAKKNISSPYVFVSFYDEKTSKAILPISFDPTPDTYINIVFYFKQIFAKPNYLPNAPIFPKRVDRGAFTAVEISEYVVQ